MMSQPLKRLPTSCHLARRMTIRALGFTARITRAAISTLGHSAFTSSKEPPTNRLRLVNVIMSSSRRTKQPTPRCASCRATCELPPPSPTRPTVAAASRASLLAPRKLCLSSRVIGHPFALQWRVDTLEQIDGHRRPIIGDPQEAVCRVVTQDKQAVRHTRRGLKKPGTKPLALFKSTLLNLGLPWPPCVWTCNSDAAGR